MNLVSEMVMCILKYWLIVSFIPEARKNKNLLFCFFHLVCLSFYQSDVAALSLCPCMRETCKRQDQTDFHHTGDCQCHVFSRSDGQYTKAKVVSDRLKTDLVTWNSLSYFENVKGTRHCYCGHNTSRKQHHQLFAGGRDTSGGKRTVPGLLFSMLLSWLTLPSESDFWRIACWIISSLSWFCVNIWSSRCSSISGSDICWCCKIWAHCCSRYFNRQDSPAHFQATCNCPPDTPVC